MRIISWNVNGLRSIYQKGFLDWFNKTNSDIVCLQEIKANINQVPFELTQPDSYHLYFNCAKKKGYSGMIIYSKKKALKCTKKLGLDRFDDEGRLLELNFPRFTLINLYLPHGKRDKSDLNYKLKVYKKLINKLEKMKNKNLILIGDFNIAHTEIDLARPSQNKNNIMFTQTERNQINKMLGLGFVDTFRKFNKKSGNYTWWPYFANARAKDLGWRIDYCFVSQKLTAKLKNAFILKNVPGSDHCPIGIEIKI